MALPLLNRITIKSKLLIAVLFASLSSIAVLALLSWYISRRALTNATLNQLTSFKTVKADQLEAYFQTRQNHVRTLGEDRMVVNAFIELNAGFDALKQSVIPVDWNAALQNYYLDQFFPTIEDKVAGDLRFSTYLADIVEAVREDSDPATVQTSDFQAYRPAEAQPVGFIASPIYDGPQMLGVLVVQLAPDGIAEMMTYGGDWSQRGLGESGEAYVVGSDFVLRSPPRFPTVAAQTADSTETDDIETSSPDSVDETDVIITPVQTAEIPTVEAALDGEESTAIAYDYRNRSVFSAYAPLNINGLNWVILAQIDTAEALSPIATLYSATLVAAAVLMALFTFLTLSVVNLLVRPIQTLKQSIRQIEAGEHHVAVNLGRDDEFGELGHAFNAMMRSISQKLALIDQKTQENETLLHNIVPPSIAERMRQGESNIAEHVKHVTILYVHVAGIADLSQQHPAEEVTQLLTRLFCEFDTAAERFGLERQSTNDTDYMAVCGLTIPRLDHVKRSVDFGLEMLKILRLEFGHDFALGLKIGVHTGSVTAGLVGRKRFGYTMWGETVYVAKQLYTQADLNTIVLTRSAYERMAEYYTLLSHRPLIVSGIGTIETWILVTSQKMAITKVDLVQSSFAKIQPIADKAAMLFYNRLFELRPALRHLFNQDMDVQQRKLMSTLAIAVEGLRNPERIINTVQDLGKRHVGYGVLNEHYEVVGEALLWALQQGLGDQFTPSVQRAWEEAYEFLSTIMKEAAAHVEYQDIGV